MGYDLYSETRKDIDDSDKYFRWNIWSWTPVLILANKYGWEPMGTKFLPLSEEDIIKYEITPESVEADLTLVMEWDGNYTDNSGQLVVDEDAQNMATALESSLDDIPTHPILIPGQEEIGGNIKLDSNYFAHRNSVREGNFGSLMTEFSGTDSKDYLRKFITFLRLGCFSIS